MLVALFILILGLTPSLVSIWLMRHAGVRSQERLRLAMESIAHRGLPVRVPADARYVEGIGYTIGDISCQFNARSSYIRCAVNPSGPCPGCLHYQPKL